MKTYTPDSTQQHQTIRNSTLYTFHRACVLVMVLLCTASFVCGTAAGAAEPDTYANESGWRNSASDIDLRASAALTSQGTTQLTTSSAADLYPSWSHDALKVIFSSNRSGNYDIWVMDSDGSNKVQLTANSANESYPVWNHADDKIAFTRYNSSACDGWGAYQLWIMNADGSEKRRVTYFNQPGELGYTGYGIACGDSSWSPDGEWLALYRIIMGKNNPDSATNPNRTTEIVLIAFE